MSHSTHSMGQPGNSSQQGASGEASDWLKQVQERQAQGFFFDETPKEKAERMSKDTENLRLAQEAGERTAKIKRGIPLDDGEPASGAPR